MLTRAILPTLAALAFVSCTKDEEERMRPQDFMGDPLAVSELVIVKPDEWYALFPGTSDDALGYAADKDLHILTDAIMQNGRVEVYLRIGANTWRPLPALRSDGTPYGLTWRFQARSGSIQFRVDADGDPCEHPPTMQTFRVVAVPG